MKRLAALYVYLAYKLEYHYWFQVSLKNWLWIVVVGPLAAALLRQLDWGMAAWMSTAGMLLLAGTVWAKSSQYVLLSDRKPISRSGASDIGQHSPPLRVDEQIRCRAFGLVAVNKRQRYAAREEALFSFVRTREHIVMAFIRRTRFLLFASSLKKDVGWWYVFVTPNRLEGIETAVLRYGLRTYAALVVRHRSEQKAEQVHELYLVFDDKETRQRAIEDLRLDLPADASG
jgi:hypothetical protein